MKPKAGIVISWFIAGIIFYLAFFVLAPFICGFVPEGEWKEFIHVAIYVGVGLLGGVQIPIIIGLTGTGISLEMGED